jgi:ureidoacrylate peracid hydrolase
MKQQKLVTLHAEPQPLEIDMTRMAIIIVDMQNAFASKGGMVDLWVTDSPAL